MQNLIPRQLPDWYKFDRPNTMRISYHLFLDSDGNAIASMCDILEEYSFYIFEAMRSYTPYLVVVTIEQLELCDWIDENIKHPWSLTPTDKAYVFGFSDESDAVLAKLFLPEPN